MSSDNQDKGDAGPKADTLPANELVQHASTEIDLRSPFRPALTPPTLLSGVDDAAPSDGFAEGFARYLDKELLGEGGMGEVRLCKDTRIGREIALKVVRRGTGSRSDLRMRFLREARVQGQLEHPAVVPVYDLGVTPEGSPYFTMKRVRGRTLEQVLAHNVEPSPDAEDRSRSRLLAAFHQVCLAVDFAHARAVVHRDLKPGNVMLGGFGEVYLLDWGLAKVRGASEPEQGGAPLDAPSGATAADAIMGTPGYMAPEQIESAEVTTAADVYALGAILFEILTRHPLHVGRSTAEVLASTARGADGRASARFPEADVPPELETICMQTTVRDPAHRPTAREVADRIERYLDGDRDVERRRAMAVAHVEAAGEATSRALRGGAEALTHRGQAMQEIGRALALDPGNRDAVRTLVKLVAEPPAEVPPEAEQDIADARMQRIRDTAAAGWLGYASWLVYGLILLAMGIEDMPLALFGVAMIVGAALTARWISTSRTTPRVSVFVLLACTSAAIAISTRVQSPFILAPAMAAANLLSVGLSAERGHRRLALVCNLVAVLVPLGLELLGVLPRTFVFEGDHLVIYPHLVSFRHSGLATLYLTVTTLAVIVTPLAILGWTRERLAHYERDAQVRAWHFRKLVPPEVQIPPATVPPSANRT